MHRTRRLRVRQRTTSANALRSASEGVAPSLVLVLEGPTSAISEKARIPLQVLPRRRERQTADIDKLEKQIVRRAKTGEVARRVMARRRRTKARQRCAEMLAEIGA
jgi:transposase